MVINSLLSGSSGSYPFFIVLITGVAIAISMFFSTLQPHPMSGFCSSQSSSLSWCWFSLYQLCSFGSKVQYGLSVPAVSVEGYGYQRSSRHSGQWIGFCIFYPLSFSSLLPLFMALLLRSSQLSHISAGGSPDHCPDFLDILYPERDNSVRSGFHNPLCRNQHPDHLIFLISCTVNHLPVLPHLCSSAIMSFQNLLIKPESHNSIAAFKRITGCPNQFRHKLGRISSDNRIMQPDQELSLRPQGILMDILQ